MPVKAFLVEAAGHRVLVDAGWSEQCATHPLRHLGFGLWFASEPVLAPGQGIGPRLANMGVEQGSIDAVVMTHLDCDHASGLADLGGVRRVLVSEPEWKAANRAHGRSVRYRPKFWSGLSGGGSGPVGSSRIETLRMVGDPHAPFGASCDLFGDGSVVAVLTPGHTEGSIVVEVRESGRFALVVGDVGYNHWSWDELRLPGPMVDGESMRKSLSWVHDQMQLPECAGVFAAHDPDAPAELR